MMQTDKNIKKSKLSQPIHNFLHTVYIAAGLVPLFVLVVVVLYVIKSLLGIDIFPNMHFFGLLD